MAKQVQVQLTRRPIEEAVALAVGKTLVLLEGVRLRELKNQNCPNQIWCPNCENKTLDRTLQPGEWHCWGCGYHYRSK